MHPSYGPQVGPSASARFNYEDPIMRSITNLSNQIMMRGKNVLTPFDKLKG